MPAAACAFMHVAAFLIRDAILTISFFASNV
jgi:hypothetical protein